MFKVLVALCALSFPAFAQQEICSSGAGVQTVNVQVSAAGNTTLITPDGGQLIKVCAIELAMPEANKIQFTSNGVVLRGPWRIQSYSSFPLGAFTTKPGMSGGQGYSLVINLLNAPSEAFSVNVSYFQRQVY